jgi:hypothetical protein
MKARLSSEAGLLHFRASRFAHPARSSYSGPQDTGGDPHSNRSLMGIHEDPEAGHLGSGRDDPDRRLGGGQRKRPSCGAGCHEPVARARHDPSARHTQPA